MKRNPRKVRWTKAFRHAHGKEMTVDATLDFEQRRNRPMRYNRDKMHLTLRAMKRISEIREARERQFYENRMKGKKEKEHGEALRELEDHISLIEAPDALRNAARMQVEEKEAQEEELLELVEDKMEEEAPKPARRPATKLSKR